MAEKAGGLVSKFREPFKVRDDATTLAFGVYGTQAPGGKADAFRHIYGTGLLAKRQGEPYAKTISQLHESPYIPIWGAMGQSEHERVMDVANNYAGLNIARTARTEAELVQRAKDYVDSGQAMTLPEYQRGRMVRSYYDAGKAQITPTYRIPEEAVARGWDLEQEAQFQKGIRATPWYGEFQKQFGEAPNLNAPEYNYRAAWQAGVRPQADPYDRNTQHWPSVSPEGYSLKATAHPTAWMEDYMQLTGRHPQQGPEINPQQAEALGRALQYRYGQQEMNPDQATWDRIKSMVQQAFGK